MKRQIILISALLALIITVNAGLAFDDRQGSTAKKGGKLHKSGDHICSAVEIALDKTGKAFEKAGNKTGQALGIAADKTSQALERAGKKIQGWFDDKPNASKKRESRKTKIEKQNEPILLMQWSFGGGYGDRPNS